MSQVNHITRQRQPELLQVGRVQVRILEDGSLTNNQLGVVEATVPARTIQTPPHLHRSHVETFLVQSGTLQFMIANGVYHVREGEFLVVPIGAIHAFSNPFDAPAVFHASFAPAHFINYLREVAELTKTAIPTVEQIYQIMARYDSYPA
jgi:quercetin dioxygenase-like cupin family protein